MLLHLDFSCSFSLARWLLRDKRKPGSLDARMHWEWFPGTGASGRETCSRDSLQDFLVEWLLPKARVSGHPGMVELRERKEES